MADSVRGIFGATLPVNPSCVLQRLNWEGYVSGYEKCACLQKAALRLVGNVFSQQVTSLFILQSPPCNRFQQLYYQFNKYICCQTCGIGIFVCHTLPIWWRIDHFVQSTSTKRSNKLKTLSACFDAWLWWCFDRWLNKSNYLQKKVEAEEEDSD